MNRYFKLLTFFALAYVCHTRSVSASAGFNDLPDDVKKLIFSKTQINDVGIEKPILDEKDLGRCAQVCKAWQKPANSDLLWQRFAVEHFHMGVISERLYAENSETARSILSSIEDKYKKMLLYKNVIQDEIGIKAVSLYKQTLSNDLTLRAKKLMIALELFGDTSCIKNYLQTKMIPPQFLFNGGPDMEECARARIKELYQLGSRILGTDLDLSTMSYFGMLRLLNGSQ